MERSLASEIFTSRLKRGKSSQHPQGFLFRRWTFAPERATSVCIQDKHNGPLWAVLFPPKSAGGGTLRSKDALSVKVTETVAYFFKWAGAVGLLFFLPFKPFPMGARHPLQGDCWIFELPSVHQQQRKETLRAPMKTHSNGQLSKPQGNSYTCKVRGWIPAS